MSHSLSIFRDRTKAGLRSNRKIAGVCRAAAFPLLLLLAGCHAGHNAGYAPAPAPQPQPQMGFKVPPGHMPPRGMCRVWFPNRAPGHQPPPGQCQVLMQQVPPGAHLIRG